MTRTAYVHANHHGYTNYDKPEVVLSFSGPRGGNKGIRCLSPAEARRVAVQLNTAADEVDPPK